MGLRIIEPYYVVEYAPEPEWLMLFLERCARTCYKSEGNISNGTASKLIKKVIERGHESVLEHSSISIRFICDRGVSHELVRHRLASFSQESTRYVRYSGDNEGNELTFIRPCFFPEGSQAYEIWLDSITSSEENYMKLLDSGAKPEQARSVLCHSLKTEIVVTANIREWRHILKLRCSPKAHPQMRQIMNPLLAELQSQYNVLFDL